MGTTSKHRLLLYCKQNRMSMDGALAILSKCVLEKLKKETSISHSLHASATCRFCFSVPRKDKGCSDPQPYLHKWGGSSGTVIQTSLLDNASWNHEFWVFSVAQKELLFYVCWDLNGVFSNLPKTTHCLLLLLLLTGREKRAKIVEVTMYSRKIALIPSCMKIFALKC